MFSALVVLYAAALYGWGVIEVGVLFALVGVLDMIVEGLLVGRGARRLGDRATMVEPR